MIRCVAMLTHNDVTVPHALEVFEANKHAAAKYWGFKDEGVTLEEGEALIQAMLAAGKHVVIEPLTTDEETANKWADLAIKYHIDGNLGFYFKSVSDKLKAAGILHFPAFGKRDDSMKLVGTIEDITKSAMEIINTGSPGIRMSAYRWTDGNPEELAVALKKKFDENGITFMMTGSVSDFGKLDFIKKMQPWGITVGGALFEEGKFGGGTVAERIDRIDAYCNSL